MYYIYMGIRDGHKIIILNERAFGIGYQAANIRRRECDCFRFYNRNYMKKILFLETTKYRFFSLTFHSIGATDEAQIK